MKNLILSSTLVLLSISLLKADIGHFDIVTIQLDSQIFYIPLDSGGELKDDDLCYYDYAGNYEMEIVDFLEVRLSSRKNIELYKNISQINLAAIDSVFDESIYYHFKDSIIVQAEEVIGHYKLLSAIKGNTYGYTFTKELIEHDIDWIKAYPAERLLNVEMGMCGVSLYGIKGNTSEQEIEEIKRKIEDLRAEDEYGRIEAYFTELYERRIIMIGFCSC